jgi:hypothetical protein
MHGAYPDGIYDGLLRELGWAAFRRDDTGGTGDFKAFAEDYYVIPETTLRELAAFFKEKLGVGTARIIGRPDMACSRVGIWSAAVASGSAGEEMPAQFKLTKDLHVLVCGEITEWTLCAYVNDAYRLGLNRGLVIVGTRAQRGGRYEAYGAVAGSAPARRARDLCGCEGTFFICVIYLKRR